MKPLKGVLIYLELARTVTSVKLPADGVSFAKLVDAEYLDCVTLRLPSARDPGAALYVDDMGMEKPDQRFWSFAPNPERIFAGKGLVTAIDEEGGTCDGVAAAGTHPRAACGLARPAAGGGRRAAFQANRADGG